MRYVYMYVFFMVKNYIGKNRNFKIYKIYSIVRGEGS